MSFRKRNVVISSYTNSSSSQIQQPHSQQSPASPSPTQPSRQQQSLPPGVRPSPLDGRLTTSTGTSSLDQLLGGHAGFPLGTSLLVEEVGTTDFGGTLLRYYAAEGLVQGHHVHILGHGESWRRDLPALDLTEGKGSRSAKKGADSQDKMKIAWRYETLGNTQTRNAPLQAKIPSTPGAGAFCHSFDLTKRLENSAIKGTLHSSPMADIPARPSQQSSFKRFLADVSSRIASAPPDSIHRIIVPSLLSPTVYPQTCCQPQEVLQLLHGLRALLRQFPSQAVAFITLPISLFPRSTGLTRWIELLSDGVLELIPLQSEIHQQPATSLSSDKGSSSSKEEKGSQGLLRVHSLPVFHEKGGGLEGGWERGDLSFRLSATSGMVITPFSLPPVGETEEEAKAAKGKSGEEKKESLDF